MAIMVLLKRFNNKKSKQQKLAMKQQSFKIFLDAEKNMFEQLKLFINIPFLLTAGCLAAIFQFDHKDRCSIYPCNFNYCSNGYDYGCNDIFK